MQDYGNSEHRSRLAAIATLRFGLINVLMILFIASLMVGGYFIWIVLIMTILIGPVGDELHSDDSDLPPSNPHWMLDISLYATLPLIIAMTLIYGHELAAGNPVEIIRVLASGGTPFEVARDLSDKAAFIAATLGLGIFYGMAANTVAHELIHRSSNPVATAIGRALLAFCFEASFPIFHVHIHHRIAGTFGDPSTARRGETVYAFARRLTVHSLREALNHEARGLRRRGISAWSWHNRLLRDQLWSFGILVAVAAIAGIRGVAGFLIAAIIGKILLVAISYAQHYGLVRVEGTPFAPRHAWDCHRSVSNALLYNLPRHSDHHQHGSKYFCELDVQPDAPRLPYGYQTMAIIALIPALWNRVMNPLLADWDRRLASEAERRLIHKRGWAIATNERVLA